MSRLWLIVTGCIIGLVCACSNKDNAPSGVIPKEKMEAVLWDMIQAERYTSAYFAKDTTKSIKLENLKLYSQVFEIHQVNKEEFIKSYKFYLSRPDISRVMFDSLATRANREREELSRPKPQPGKADSAKTQPAQPTQTSQPVTTVKDSLGGIKKRTDSGVLKRLVTDTLRRRLLRPGRGNVLRPGMNRDSLLKGRQ
jgi:hypothetical protein